MTPKELLETRISTDVAEALELEVIEADVTRNTGLVLREQYETTVGELRERCLVLGVNEQIVDEIIIGRFVQEAKPVSEAAAYANALVQTQQTQAQRLDAMLSSLYDMFKPMGNTHLIFQDPDSPQIPGWEGKKCAIEFEFEFRNYETEARLKIDYGIDSNESGSLRYRPGLLFNIETERSRPKDARVKRKSAFWNTLLGEKRAKIRAKDKHSYTINTKGISNKTIPAKYIHSNFAHLNSTNCFLHLMREHSRDSAYVSLGRKISQIPHMAREALKQRSAYMDSLGLDRIES